jgi:hypothetical protein
MVFNNDDPKKVMVALRRIILTSGASDQGLIFHPVRLAMTVCGEGCQPRPFTLSSSCNSIVIPASIYVIPALLYSHPRESGDLGIMAPLQDPRFRGDD